MNKITLKPYGIVNDMSQRNSFGVEIINSSNTDVIITNVYVLIKSFFSKKIQVINIEKLIEPKSMFTYYVDLEEIIKLHDNKKFSVIVVDSIGDKFETKQFTATTFNKN
jgi:cystathionine beta-lyase/cystathionine gamma-synthase